MSQSARPRAPGFIRGDEPDIQKNELNRPRRDKSEPNVTDSLSMRDLNSKGITEIENVYRRSAFLHFCWNSVSWSPMIRNLRIPIKWRTVIVLHIDVPSLNLTYTLIWVMDICKGESHQAENDKCPYLSICPAGTRTDMLPTTGIKLPFAPSSETPGKISFPSVGTALSSKTSQGTSVWAHLGAQHVQQGWYLWCGNGLLFIQHSEWRIIVPQTPLSLFLYFFTSVSLQFFSLTLHLISFSAYFIFCFSVRIFILHILKYPYCTWSLFSSLMQRMNCRVGP